MSSANNNIEIANTIVCQMGGMGRLRAMLGVKQAVAIERGVQFKFPNRLRSRGNRVRVQLNDRDTYQVDFWNGTKLVGSFSDVYADQLKSVFENQTGLRLSL